VIQDQGKVLLVNSGTANTARFAVLPFLQQQGINQMVGDRYKFSMHQ